LDALFAGCKLVYAYSSVRGYDEAVEKDIYDIVKLMPNSIHCNLGYIRSRHLITPLYAACVNENIPLHIVKLLLDSGADIEQKIYLNSKCIDILADIIKIVSSTRYFAIHNMFSQQETIASMT
jgi:hypothetical protein